MTPYEKLKAVIQTTNPEIMELKFGCELRLKDDWAYPDYRAIYAGKRYEEGEWIYLVKHKNEQLYKIDKKYEILGRPIRLADVLLAIEQTTQPPEKYMVSTNGIITFRESKEITAQVFNSRFLSTGVSWNLKDDNLDHQSEECKEFLIDLLTSQQ